MAAALSNELGMMENQLSRSKDAASEALALREQAESLTSLVAKKVYIRSCQAFLLHLYFLYSAYSCFVLEYIEPMCIEAHLEAHV